MMGKKNYVIILIFLVMVGNHLYSQTSVPQIGTTWYYSAYADAPSEGYYRMEYVADIEKGGKLCKQMLIREMDPWGQLSSGYYSYLLYEDRKIYHYIDYFDNIEPAFYLLYDFNVKEGDKIQTSYVKSNKTVDHFSLTVYEVRDTVIHGETLVCYTFRNEDYFEGISEIGFDGVAIENIGNVGNYWFFPIEHYHLSDFWLPREFRCYTNQDFHIQAEGYVRDCDWYDPFTSVDTYTSDPPRISFQDNNSLSVENIPVPFSFVLFDSQGKKLLQGRNVSAKTVDVSTLLQGLYLLQVKTDSQSIGFRFVKR